jgi:predicted permease
MFRHSLRNARRLLMRDRGLTAVVLLTLTLGIGANTIVFSLLHGVLLSPLPYPAPERLVRIFETHPEFPKFPMSPGNFLEFRRDTRAFEHIAVFTRADLQLSGGPTSGGSGSSSRDNDSPSSSSSDARPERLAAMQVSAEYFKTLGVTPAWGRTFHEDDMRPDHRVIILSDRLWRRRFNADPTIIGRTLRLSAESWTVVGILPPHFEHVGGSYRSLPHGDTVDAWTPTWFDPKQPMRNAHFMNAVGRLKPGVTMADASGDLNRIAAELEKRYPRSNAKWRTRLTPLREEIVGSADSLLMMLVAAAAAVLLIGCANVASLLLARAIVRRREMAVRLALGASARSLIGQVLSESLLLSVLGGALGFAVAIAGIRVLTGVMPEDFPRLHMIHLDWRVLTFTAALACATALIFGLFPAVHSASPDVQGLIRDGGRGASAGRHTSRLRHGLVIAEVAIASALLIAAGLLTRSFIALMNTDPGFRAERVLTFTLALPPVAYPKPADGAALFVRLIDRLSALPGVQLAGATTALPWTGWDENTSFDIIGDRHAGERSVSGSSPHARFNAVTPDYFRAVGVPLLRGRFFDARDAADPVVVAGGSGVGASGSATRAGAGAGGGAKGAGGGTSAPGGASTAGTAGVAGALAKVPKTVLINNALARAYFPGDDPVGRMLNLWGDERQIVGVVGDIKDSPAALTAEPAVYFPHAQQTFRAMTVALKTTGADPLTLVSSAREVVRSLDPEMPLAEIRALDDVARAAHAERRFLLTLVTVFGGLALVLSAIGAYGVISYSAAQRGREFGVRLALGAGRPQILRLVLTQGLRLTTAGLALGLLLALLLGRVMRTLLYGISPTDLTTFAVVSGVTLIIALIASLLPAHRASRADPIRALRTD